jgi:hypothetical protein
MKIISTNEKGHVAIILNEEEINTIMNLSLPGIQGKAVEIKVKNEDPLKGFHTDNRMFIVSLYKKYGEGEIIKFSNPYFNELRRSLFILSPKQIIQKLHRRGIVEHDVENKQFMFMKSPLLISSGK